MKLIAQIENEQREVLLKKDENGVFAEIDGRKYELEVSRPEPNIYLLKNEGRIYEIFVSPRENPENPFNVNVRNENFEIMINDPKKLKTAGSGAGQTEGMVEIKTAMPGKVVRVLVEVEQEVKTGEGVMVVEAMKMQNEMKTPKDGLVKEIKFSEGETVNAGDVLVVIE